MCGETEVLIQAFSSFALNGRWLSSPFLQCYLGKKLHYPFGSRWKPQRIWTQLWKGKSNAFAGHWILAAQSVAVHRADYPSETPVFVAICD